eukprot:GILK01011670.1.p1 GENE.GILK01011670.1~~GILK01011670.1.p1  ORF type:complete len:132 (+),score=11.52 GILK01011670.1:30-425(+)
MSSSEGERLMPPPVRHDATQEDLNVAQKFFYGGFFLLPWMWGINVWYFRSRIWPTKEERDFRDRFPYRVHLQQPSAEVRSYVIKSFWLFLLSVVIFAIWVTVFQTSWRNWGQTGFDLLVLPPNHSFNTDVF